MGKLNIGKSFRNKKFKYGGYATLLTAIVIAVVIVANLVVDQLNLKLDLTKNKMFSLSDQSVNILKDLKNDVIITGLYEAGKENTMVRELLNKYRAQSNKIKVEYVDPIQHPQFTKKYAKEGESIDEGSLIVESGNKFRIITAADMYNYNMNQQTLEQTPESLAIEQRLTGALMYVSSDKNPVVYALKGHNEQTIPYELTKTMENENYTTNELDLVAGEWKYEEGDILYIASPQRDISPDELKKISDFMAKGGRTIVLKDFTVADTPNLDKLLNSYGVNIQKALVLEGDTKNMIQERWYLLPNRKSHTILDPLTSAKIPVIMPGVQPIEEIKVRKASLTIEPLLYTSDSAYAKANIESQTQEKEAGDLSGPFNVAVAITDKLDPANPDKTSKMIVISSSQFLNSTFIQASNGGNTDLFMNSINWLVDKKESISIRPKSLSAEYLNMNGLQALVIAGLVVIVIPLIVAVSGITVWLRRRHL